MTFLSSDWLDRTVTTAADQAVLGSFTGTVGVEVTGGPDGKVVARWTFDAGRPNSLGVDGGGDPEVMLTLTHDDARSLVAGTRDLNALFISGQMKVAGDTGPLLDLIAATKTDEFGDYLARLHAGTED